MLSQYGAKPENPANPNKSIRNFSKYSRQNNFKQKQIHSNQNNASVRLKHKTRTAPNSVSKLTILIPTYRIHLNRALVFLFLATLISKKEDRSTENSKTVVIKYNNKLID